MGDPSLAVQGAIVSLLASVSPATVDGRVYDRVPETKVFPYISVGEGDSVGDDNPCWNASEVSASVHIWSRAVGWPEAKALASEVRQRLSMPLDLTPDFGSVVGEFRVARWLNDPDGITRHAALEFRYLIDHEYN